MTLNSLKLWCLERAIKCCGGQKDDIMPMAEKFYDFMAFYGDEDNRADAVVVGVDMAAEEEEEKKSIFLPVTKTKTPMPPVKPPKAAKKPKDEKHPAKVFEEKTRRAGKTSPINEGREFSVESRNKGQERKPNLVPDLKSLTQKQEMILREIVLMNKTKIETSLTGIARRIEETPQNIQNAVNALVRKHYIQKKKSDYNNKHVFVAVFDESRNDLTSQGVKDEETGITKCPPAYASGYGMSPSQFEGL